MEKKTENLHRDCGRGRQRLDTTDILKAMGQTKLIAFRKAK